MKPGYKLAEVGEIPEDWVESPISSIVTEFRGGAPLKPTDFTSFGVKVLPKGGVGRTGKLRVLEKDIQYCSPQYANLHQRNQVHNGHTIVVLRDLVPSGPSIGLMVEIDTDERYVLAQGVYGFKVNPERAEPRYLIQISNTAWYRKLANSIMVGSTQVHITNGAFKKIQIPLPSLSEQRTIAAALSDVDTLLTKLDQLISKKRDLKRAAMQQLLAGEIRLPGFSGEWTTRTIKDVTRIPVTDGPHLTPKFLADGIPFLSVNNLVDNKIDFENVRYISKDDHEVFSRKCKPQKHDLLFGKAASVGKIAIVQTDVEFNIWSPIALIRLNECAVPLFVYYCMQGQLVLSQITILTNSSSQGNIGMGDIERLNLLLPTVDEQNVIARLLSDMDTELAALEARREKTRYIKQGMMQELLTGRTRLI